MAKLGASHNAEIHQSISQNTLSFLIEKCYISWTNGAQFPRLTAESIWFAKISSIALAWDLLLVVSSHLGS